jgi:hypothetical protein
LKGVAEAHEHCTMEMLRSIVYGLAAPLQRQLG